MSESGDRCFSFNLLCASGTAQLHIDGDKPPASMSPLSYRIPRPRVIGPK